MIARKQRAGRRALLWTLAGVAAGAALAVVISSSLDRRRGPRNQSIGVYERDGSVWTDWAGHPYPTAPLKLDESVRVSTSTHDVQQFNPCVLDPRPYSLEDVFLLVTFPPELEIDADDRWTTESINKTGSVYSARLGNIGRGQCVNGPTAIRFRAKTAGRFVIRYSVNTNNTDPANGAFQINVR